MDTPEQKWVVFDLDVNLSFGTVSNREKWNDIVRYYRNVGSDIEDITRAKRLETRKGDLRPGFSFKGTGPTLAEWAKENEIDLTV